MTLTQFDKKKIQASPPIRDSQLVLLRAVILHVGQLVTGKETELCTMLLYLACVAPSSVSLYDIGGAHELLSEN